MKILRKSENSYAKNLVNNKIPPKIYESFNKTQLKKLDDIQSFLKEEKVDYIKCSSSSRLSKYYRSNPVDQRLPSIQVVRKTYKNSNISYSNIEDATDLFQKFSESHAITRLHCEIEGLNKDQKSHLSKLLH